MSFSYRIILRGFNMKKQKSKVSGYEFMKQNTRLKDFTEEEKKENKTG